MMKTRFSLCRLLPNRAVTLAPAFAVVLSGCAAKAPERPDGPPVTIADTVKQVSQTEAHFFQLARIDGAGIKTSAERSVSADYGRGIELSPEVLEHQLPAAGRTLTIEAVARYARPELEPAGGAARVTGNVEFKPEPGELYFIRGKFWDRGGAVWIEDMSGNAVTRKIQGALETR